MKMHHLLVAAILGGFFVFTFAVGCSNSPTEAEFTQGDGESWISGDDDLTITKKKAVKKKTKKKAKRVYKGKVTRKKKAVAKKKVSKGIGHVTYKKKAFRKKTATQEAEPSDAPFSFGVIVQDVPGVRYATLNVGDAEGSEYWRIAYLYESPDLKNGTDANGTTGILMRGELDQLDLNQAEISVQELAEYLAMGETFIHIITSDPEEEMAGQLMEVDQTPLRKKVEEDPN